MKITNYLDITLNLIDGSYRPCRKPSEETNYIHINSDHPPSIIKEIPRSIKKRLPILSSFFYEKCLKTMNIKPSCYINNQKKNSRNKKKRTPNTIWLNPTYSQSVKTNIEKIFIKLIGKHFPPNRKFVKIFNKNTISLVILGCPTSDQK